MKGLFRKIKYRENGTNGLVGLTEDVLDIKDLILKITLVIMEKTYIE